MSKAQPFIIDIPKPCHEGWDEMTPVKQGKYCNSCKQAVLDFTTFNDAQLYNFFSGNTRNVCGRFYAAQLGRQLYLPPQPRSRLYRIAIAAGLTLLFFNAGELSAHPKPPLVFAVAVDSPATKNTPHIDSVQIEGCVTDNKKEPIINASVRLSKGGVTVAGTITDYDGKYKLSNLESGEYELTFSYVGLKSQSVTGVEVTNKNVREVNVILSRDEKFKLNKPVKVVMGRLPLMRKHVHD